MSGPTLFRRPSTQRSLLPCHALSSKNRNHSAVVEVSVAGSVLNGLPTGATILPGEGSLFLASLGSRLGDLHGS